VDFQLLRLALWSSLDARTLPEPSYQSVGFQLLANSRTLPAARARRKRKNA
jgi:hypothetical protein